MLWGVYLLHCCLDVLHNAHTSCHTLSCFRQEELGELDDLQRSCCKHQVKGGVENKHGKINILMQVCREEGGVWRIR